MITKGEFGDALKELGFKDLKPRELDALMEHFDGDGDGRVSYSEFLEFVSLKDGDVDAPSRSRSTNPLQNKIQNAVRRRVKAGIDIRKLIRLYDTTNSGVVSAGDFQEVLMDIGLSPHGCNWTAITKCFV